MYTHIQTPTNSTVADDAYRTTSHDLPNVVVLEVFDLG
jgi:hypothetical protein